MLIFDIETTALANAEDYIEPARAPSNYKDPVKIAQYVAEKQATELEQAALDPDLCSVRGIVAHVDGFDVAHVVGEGLPELDLIQMFWTTFAEHRGQCCGYNVLGYDLPVLMHRSMALGIEVPLVPDLRRYQAGPVYDLYGLLFNWSPGRGLKWVAKRYGMEILSPDVDGSDVAAMNAEQLRQYMQSEMHLLKQLYRRMQPAWRLPGLSWSTPLPTPSLFDSPPPFPDSPPA